MASETLRGTVPDWTRGSGYGYGYGSGYRYGYGYGSGYGSGSGDGDGSEVIDDPSGSVSGSASPA